MPKACPPEFRDEVVRVGPRRKQHLRETANDFGISESRPNRWLAIDEIESGDQPGVTKVEAAETRELKKRNKILKDEYLILRRAAAFFAKEMLPKMMYGLVEGLAAEGVGGHVVSGARNWRPDGEEPGRRPRWRAAAWR